MELGSLEHVMEYVTVVKGLSMKEILGEEGKRKAVRWIKEVRRLRGEMEKREAVNK